MIIMIIITSYQ